MTDGLLPERAGHHTEEHHAHQHQAHHGSVAVSRRVMASWQRSADYGVSPETTEPSFTGTFDQQSLFFECGNAVLNDLHQTLADEPISLMLTDSMGLVLNRLSGDAALLRALDAVHLAPGFAFSEREAGTNGLALALADRVPTVVRAEEHYSASLAVYTCAAAPVLDPVTGRLEGTVNITTWARSSSDLLLALAQSAAGTTSALMLARSRGRIPRPSPRGEVFRVLSARLEPGAGTERSLSRVWTDAVGKASRALSAGLVVAAVGEPGSGRSTLLAQAQRAASPHDRILSASPPAPQDIDAWLSLWSPELGKPHTAVIVCDVDALPAGAANRLADMLRTARAGLHRGQDDSLPPLPYSMTSERFADIPKGLATLVDTVVQVPPLRDRPDDVLILAQSAARKVRGRDVDFTTAAANALRVYGWPGNVDQLNAVVRHAASRADVVDVRDLPSEVLTGSRHRLTRIESFERDEIARTLTRPGVTMKQAADELGMSRATIYRKVAQYDLHIPKT